MYRLAHQVESDWVAYSHPPVFEHGDRIVAGVPGSDPAIFQRMVACMTPPYLLLYVLHTPRGEAAPGRYQSPALSGAEVDAFLSRFGPFLSVDARFDLWAHSPGEHATVVWDRHDRLFAYGPLARFSEALQSLGFVTGTPSVPEPHEHHYRKEVDPLARELIAAFDWRHSPLRPEDEQ